MNGHRRRLTWEATPRSIHEGKIEFYILRVFAAKVRCEIEYDLVLQGIYGCTQYTQWTLNKIENTFYGTFAGLKYMHQGLRIYFV